jgi:hypothetical protein
MGDLPEMLVHQPLPGFRVSPSSTLYSEETEIGGMGLG